MAQPVAPSPPALPPPPPIVHPSSWWYALTVGIGVLGLVLAISAGVEGSRQAKETRRDRTVLELGSSATVTFDRVDQYTLYFFGRVPDGTVKQSAAIFAAIRPQLLPAGGGAALLLKPARDNAVYNGGGGQQAIALATFQVDDLGDYTFTSDNFGLSTTSDDAALVIQGSPLRRWASGLARGLLILVAAGLVSVISSVALAFARGRDRRALALSRPPGGPVPWRPPAGQTPQWSGYPGGGYPGAPPGPPPAPIVPPPPPGYGPPDGR